ncbi:transglutaminase-like cysteine peptidase [Oricola cellulosilytica]|uniref:Transglutaminase n=1 Tax=Oricola cellulosilytica TaxID=1429082 RepID=A0A4R0PBE4_9HYPH|nr:transglutaminase-like cysteine peptidase [Oricola cellulosilytica]TCD14581.1 transglutaminase [Oricola cellulosilytica]
MTTFKKKFSLISAATAGLLLVAGSAQASPMQIGNLTSQPVGHYEFCQQVPLECNPITGKSAPGRLTQDTWRKMVQVNATINRAIAPRTDKEMWGIEELWSYPLKYGDCEDYVLLKRYELIKAGFSPSNLLITVVLQPNGEGHAVLTVRTDKGDFILDNLVGEVLDWRDTRYRYLKRQASEHAGRWVSIIDERTTVAHNF